MAIIQPRKEVKKQMRRVCFVLVISIAAAMLASAVSAVVSVTPTPGPVPIVVEGLITAITVATTTSGTITVAPPPSPTGTPPPKTIVINDKTRLFKDGKACTLAELAVGDFCRAMVVRLADGTYVGLIVHAKTVVPPLKTARGTIVEKTLDSTWGRTFKLQVPGVDASPTILMWFSVDATTRITVDGKPANYDLLAVGQLAEVAYVEPPPSPLTVIQPILAAAVAAVNPPPPPATHVIGRLCGVDLANGIIVVGPRGTNVRLAFKITDATKIDKFGPAPLAALVKAGVIPGYPGDMVDVGFRTTPSASILPPAAVSVLVLPEALTGVVRGVLVDPNGVTGTVMIAPLTSTGAVMLPIPIRVVPATKIIKNGVPVTIQQLAIDDRVSVRFFQFTDAKVASLIEARSLPPGPL